MQPTEQSLSATIQEIISNLQTLVRAEIRLARAEIVEEFGDVRAAGILLFAGFLAALLSAAFLLVGALFALRLVLPSWAAAMIVALSAGIAAAICLFLGAKRFKLIHALPKTAASLKESMQWARHPTR